MHSYVDVLGTALRRIHSLGKAAFSANPVVSISPSVRNKCLLWYWNRVFDGPGLHKTDAVVNKAYLSSRALGHAVASWIVCGFIFTEPGYRVDMIYNSRPCCPGVLKTGLSFCGDLYFLRQDKENSWLWSFRNLKHRKRLLPCLGLRLLSSNTCWRIWFSYKACFLSF